MALLFILIITSSWFQRDFQKAKEMYYQALKGEEGSENPFVYFLKAIEFEKAGNLEEARSNFEKAKLFSNLEPSIIFLMYVISERKNLPDFESELFSLLLKSKIKKRTAEIPEISEYLLKSSETKALLSLKIKELDKALLISPSFYPAWYEKLKLYYINLKFPDFIKTFLKFSPFFSGNPLVKEIFNLSLIRTLILFSFSITVILLFGLTIRRRHSIYFFTGQNIPHIPELEFLFSILFVLFIFFRAPLPFFFLLILPTLFYLNNKEKIILFIFSLFILLIAILSINKEKFSLNFVTSHRQNPYYLLYITKNSPYDEDLIKEWDKLEIKEKELIKAIIFMKGNKIEEAQKSLKNVRNKSSYTYLVNLGNLYFLKSKYDSASVFYKNAIDRNPEGFEAHFNLAQVAFQLVDLDLFQKEIDILNQLDAKRTEKYTRMIKEYKLTPIVYAYPEKFENFKFKKTKSELFSNIYLFPPFLIPLILVILFLIVFLRKHLRFKRCRACYRRIPEGGEEIEPVGEVCEKCKKELISTESLKLRQRLAARLKAKRLDRVKNGILISNLIMPGLGFVINNSFILFILTAGIFSISLIILYFTSFDLFGIIFYILAVLISLLYYIAGGKIDESI